MAATTSSMPVMAVPSPAELGEIDIVRPRTAEEVAQVVSHAVSHSIPFTVRVGGYGHMLGDNNLIIDIRELNDVEVAKNRKTAKVGGGVLSRQVIADLSAHGLMTPASLVHWGYVGFVPWASQGGWGLFNNQFGFGVDQIVAATVVDAAGKIVEANEEMLRAIRGGSGNVGVIVDMTVRVYELEKVLAGVITLDTVNGVGETFTQFMSGLQRLYDQGLSTAVTIDPVVEGSSISVSFVWSSSDLDAGKACMDQVLSISPVTSHTITEMSISAWAKEATQYGEDGLFGKARAVNVTKWSHDVEDVVEKVVAAMPADTNSSVLVRCIGSELAAKEASCFNPEMRQPHFMIQLIGNTLSEAKRDEVTMWVDMSYRALRSCDTAMGSAQPTLLELEDRSPENVFGSQFQCMKSLKKAYDPKAVFFGALPSI